MWKEDELMTETYMRHLIREDKIGKALAPLEIIYALWLILTVMFNFKAFMVSLTAGFIVIAVYAICDGLFFRPKKGR